MQVGDRGDVGAVILVIRIGPIPFVCRKRRGTAFQPAATEEGFVVVVKVIKAERELVGGAYADAVVKRQAPASGGCLSTPTIPVCRHGTDAESSIIVCLEIEVTCGAQVISVASRDIHLMFGDGPCRLADLVHHAAGGAAPEQHGGRAAQNFNAVVVKGVSVVLGNVTHTVEVNVTSNAETAQADVVSNAAAFARFKRDANDVFERALEAVFALVVNQFFVYNR